MTLAPPSRRVWDHVLTIVTFVLFLGVVLLCVFAGAMTAFAGDSCGASSNCNYDVLGTAFMIGAIGPIVVAVPVTVVTIVQLARRRVAFYVPIIGGALAIGVVVVAFVTATSGVTPIS